MVADVMTFAILGPRGCSPAAAIVALVVPFYLLLSELLGCDTRCLYGRHYSSNSQR